MPVLPLVASTILVRPGSILPSASAASIMATPMRSLTLPPGLNASSFAYISTPLAPAAVPSSIRGSPTNGVSPTSSAMLIGIRAMEATTIVQPGPPPATPAVARPRSLSWSRCAGPARPRTPFATSEACGSDYTGRDLLVSGRTNQFVATRDDHLVTAYRFRQHPAFRGEFEHAFADFGRQRACEGTGTRPSRALDFELDTGPRVNERFRVPQGRSPRWNTGNRGYAAFRTRCRRNGTSGEIDFFHFIHAAIGGVGHGL